jgi:SAM-dependent methyltransferase
MPTGTLQGELWSAEARDWAGLQEPLSAPLYRAVLDALPIRPGQSVLDVGCGSGLFLRMAAERGAVTTGLDAAGGLLGIARDRLPAGRFEAGEMEALPFPDRSFDVVTGFTSFPFAADPVAALREARRVVRAEGRVVVAVWGAARHCEAMALMGAMARLAPQPPGAEARRPAPAEPAGWQDLLAEAGLMPLGMQEVAVPFTYGDGDAYRRAMCSSALGVRAVRAAGVETVRTALLAAGEPFRAADGSYRFENRFCFILATV